MKEPKYRYYTCNETGFIHRATADNANFLLSASGQWDNADFSVQYEDITPISKQTVDFFIADLGYNSLYFQRPTQPVAQASGTQPAKETSVQ